MKRGSGGDHKSSNGSDQRTDRALNERQTTKLKESLGRNIQRAVSVKIRIDEHLRRVENLNRELVDLRDAIVGQAELLAVERWEARQNR